MPRVSRPACSDSGDSVSGAARTGAELVPPRGCRPDRARDARMRANSQLGSAAAAAPIASASSSPATMACCLGAGAGASRASRTSRAARTRPDFITKSRPWSRPRSASQRALTSRRRRLARRARGACARSSWQAGDFTRGFDIMKRTGFRHVQSHRIPQVPAPPSFNHSLGGARCPYPPPLAVPPMYLGQMGMGGLLSLAAYQQ